MFRTSIVLFSIFTILIHAADVDPNASGDPNADGANANGDDGKKINEK
jgi:hypothetical protein